VILKKMNDNEKDSHLKTHKVMFENINYFVVLKRNGKRITHEFVSEQEFLSLLGYDFYQRIPQLILDYIYPKDIEEKIRFQQKFQTKQEKTIDMYEFTHKDGTTIPVIKFTNLINRANLIKQFNLHVIVKQYDELDLEVYILISKLLGNILFNLLKN